MKRKLLTILSVLVIVGAAQNLSAQTSPTASNQPQPTKKTTTTVKKWQRPNPASAALAQQNGVKAPIRVDTVKNTDFSLNGQYQFLLSRSRSVNGYKLVNPYRLSAVWKSAIDSLAKEKTALNTLKVKVTEQEKTISTLRTAVKGSETEVADTNAKVDEITFLGISFTKGTYNIIVWSIIAVLTIAVIVVVARSTKNILEAKHRTQLYDEVSAEYQAFKAKSVEKERKLARELQDERNKIDEMKGRG